MRDLVQRDVVQVNKETRDRLITLMPMMPGMSGESIAEG